MISTIVTVAFTAAYYAVAIYMVRGIKLKTRDLSLCGIVIAMTVVLESIFITLPTGANIALLSPVPLFLLAILVDGRLAIISGWICGALVMLTVPEWRLVHWGQFFVEHMVCLSCLGFASVFGTDKRWKILCGIALASAIKIIGHTLSGVLFFSQNAPTGWGAWFYSLVYNLSQNIPLCALSAIVVLAIPLNSLRRAILKENKA